ncbi:MAG: M14 family zinc carboxypeptidase [Armatimonadia bacterium]
MLTIKMLRVGALVCALCLSAGAGLWAQAERPNLLANPGFEAGEEGWERRTPDSAERTLSITPEALRSGKAGARIVNHTRTDSRWRQGSTRTLAAEPGSVMRLSGWIRTDLGPDGYAALRLYAMDEKGEITAQPTSRPVVGKSDWTRSNVSLTVPANTKYLMAYLELPGAIGAADFDDLELVVVRAPRVRKATADLALVTDAPDNDMTVSSLRTLYPALAVKQPGEPVDKGAYRGLIALERGTTPCIDMAKVEAFAAAGGLAVADLSLYARLRGLTVKEQSLAPEQAVLRIAAEHSVTRGFKRGDTIPWYAGERDKTVQRSLQGKITGQVLCEAADGSALVVYEKMGTGALLATDLSGLPEPVWNQPGSFNKYLFAGNLLGNSVRYGRHFAQRMPYAEFVEMMRKLAESHKEARLRDEGPSSGDQRMYTLSLGDEGKPAIFIYGAAHGSEWESAYGLLALAERLLERPEEKLFDFGRYQLVMMPLVNPWGYDNPARHNANKVDLNRNGDVRWQEYAGTPNKDGVYGPGCYDWKGTAPYSEPETQAWKRVLDRVNPRAVLDFHGNAGGAGNNRLIFIPSTGQPGNEDRVHDMAQRFDEAMADRYVLREANRPGVQQYAMETISWEQVRPTLITSACPNRLGLIVEVPAGYRSTYGLVFQTDLVIETCLAFFRAYE